MTVPEVWSNWHFQRHNCSVGKIITLLTFLKCVTTSVPAFQIPVKCIIMALLTTGIFLKAARIVFIGNTGRTPCNNSLHSLSCYELFFSQRAINLSNLKRWINICLGISATVINIRSSKPEVSDYAQEGKSCPWGEGQAQQSAHDSLGQDL